MVLHFTLCSVCLCLLRQFFRSGIEETFTEEDQLLQEVLEIWQEKKAEESKMSAEKEAAASGHAAVLKMRAEAVERHAKKRKARAEAGGEGGDDEDDGGDEANEEKVKRRRLDINAGVERRMNQKDGEIDLRWRELELAEAKRKDEAEERKVFMALLKKQAGM